MTKVKYKKDNDKTPKKKKTGQQPGVEEEMISAPVFEDENSKGSDKLKGKNALITGGDSGIGRAIAVAFAKEGANVAIAYLDESEDVDAEKTVKLIENYGGKTMMIRIDISKEENCKNLINDVVTEFGCLNILVNNAGKQFPKTTITEITSEQLLETFETNFFSLFFLTKAAIEHMTDGDSIINTSSVTAYNGSSDLMDYSATKGAITSFTRSLALNLVDKGIRVNSVAPGPIWTPLIPSTFDKQKVKQFGNDTPMKRHGQPVENAPAYVFLASSDSSYMTGQTIHVNGGGFVGS